MITTDFLSTVSFKQACNSMYCLSFGFFGLQKGKQIDLLVSDLEKYFELQQGKISLFYNARSALYNYLLGLKLERESEVILSGYNCVSVSNAVIQAELKPVYVDIESDSFGIDFEELKNIVTKNTKVIILQHSFGMPARDTQEIIDFAKKKGIILLEDVAHSLGAELHGKKLGTLGDAAIFSTGRDKVISSVNGAFLVDNTQKSVGDIELVQVPTALVIKNHIYNILGYIAFKTYGIGPFGKIIMLAGKRLKLFPDILTKSELLSNEKKLNYEFPSSLAYCLRKELDNLETYMQTRRQNTKVLRDSYLHKNTHKSNYFRVPHICKNEESKETLYEYMKNNGVLLGISWTGKNIAPINIDLKKAQYTLGSCPIAEDIAKKIVFLPNAYNRSEKDIEKVNRLLDKFYNKNV